MGRELLSRVTTQIPRAFRKPQALPVLRPPINAGSRLSLTTAVLINVCTLERGSSGTIFHPPPRPVLSSSGSLHWGCVCTYPFTGNHHYTRNILKYCPLCQVDSNLKSTQTGKTTIESLIRYHHRLFSLRRHQIHSAWMKRMAFGNTLCRKQRSFERTVHLNCLHRVSRAGRIETTCRRLQWRDIAAIHPNGSLNQSAG